MTKSKCPTFFVTGTLDGKFRSGTGRFENVSGIYEFFLVATLQPEPLEGGGLEFATEAEITGEIHY